ncbi:MAG: hypothetical protein F6K08_30650 [Okeania sp. SIO1H6]|nr:hypothetical protein [Okeania sp. SIO1H6]
MARYARHLKFEPASNTININWSDSREKVIAGTFAFNEKLKSKSALQLIQAGKVRYCWSGACLNYWRSA